jgi:hypothetical protein
VWEIVVQPEEESCNLPVVEAAKVDVLGNQARDCLAEVALELLIVKLRAKPPMLGPGHPTD